MTAIKPLAFLEVFQMLTSGSFYEQAMHSKVFHIICIVVKPNWENRHFTIFVLTSVVWLDQYLVVFVSYPLSYTSVICGFTSRFRNGHGNTVMTLCCKQSITARDLVSVDVSRFLTVLVNHIRVGKGIILSNQSEHASVFPVVLAHRIFE